MNFTRLGTVYAWLCVTSTDHMERKLLPGWNTVMGWPRTVSGIIPAALFLERDPDATEGPILMIGPSGNDNLSPTVLV